MFSRKSLHLIISEICLIQNITLPKKTVTFLTNFMTSFRDFFKLKAQSLDSVYPQEHCTRPLAYFGNRFPLRKNLAHWDALCRLLYLKLQKQFAMGFRKHKTVRITRHVGKAPRIDFLQGIWNDGLCL